MNADTRKWLLENYSSENTDWLQEVDDSDEFERETKANRQRARTLQSAYGIVVSYPQELQVRLQGANADAAGVGEKLEGVQVAVRSLFATAPFKLPLKLVNITKGSTVMHFVPEGDDLVHDAPILDDPNNGGFIESSADKPSFEVLQMLEDIEENQDIQRWNKALKGASKLTNELQKTDLDASFIWYSSNGDVRRTRYTENGRNHYFATVNKIFLSEDTIPVSGRILTMATKENDMVEVHIKTGPQRNSTAYDVLIPSITLRGMDLFLGDSVSWLVKSHIEKNGIGEVVSQRYDFYKKLDYDLVDPGALFDV